MSYAAAIEKAWGDLLKLNPAQGLQVRFLADQYSIDPENKKVTSLSRNTLAKDFTAILILHYLARKLKGLPAVTGEWLTFRELSGVEGYAEAFRKRCIEPIIRKYGVNPQGLFSALERLPGRRLTEQADAAVLLDAFEGVPARVLVWGADAEFGPEANIFFDRSVKEIFCTEDIIVLAGMVAVNL